MPEEEQELGRIGAKRVKRLLEATLRFKLPYNAYQHAERVELTMLTGIRETYDLNGDYLDEGGQEVTRIFVESKNLDGAGNQSTEYKRFLAQAYSATMHVLGEQKKGKDPKYEFMWATTCPWKGDGFRHVASWTALRDAVEWDRTRDLEQLVAGKKKPRVIPDDHLLDEDVARVVATRLWVWVISERHEEMTLGSKMRGWIEQRLAMEEDTP